ncbi:hypothetical protein VVD49_11390 [Uliginosibacterium sp. H3]|uniref:DUF4136 domain-containing protein n=1 Tax=Uliginosibacterium silvisoli TaxID=3114758 RepID=A0ABU6K3W7_9RHOO|nr:hypothetical protein [Uliginosibacterium sp. H3]
MCLLPGFLLSACSSTRLSSEWRQPDDVGPSPQKLAVIAVVKDDSISRLVEDEAVRRLPPSTHAVSARQLGFTPGADIDALRGSLQEAGFDAAVITRLVAIDERELYHPPQTYFIDNRPLYGMAPLYSPYYRDFWRFYPYATSVAVTPAYKTRETRYITETVLYRLPSGKPIWSAVTETLNPSSTLTLINEVVRLVQKQMNRAGVVDAR